MNRYRFQRPPHPSAGVTRAIAWLALLLATLAFLMSGATLLLTWRGERLGQDTQDLIQTIQGKLTGKLADEAPAPSSAPSRFPDLSGSWDAVREKLHRAQGMIQNEDGRAEDYLGTLKVEIEALRKNTSETGSRWLDEASARLKSIREQVAVNGPEAARRLRELTRDFQEKAHTFQRVSDALHATEGQPQGTPDPEPGATPLKEDAPQ